MNIAWFSPHFADGGVQKSVLQMSELFIEHGHDVELITFNINSQMLVHAPEKLTVTDLNSSRAVTSVPKLARHIRRTRPDVLISTQHFANVTAAIAMRLARTETKLILTERSATTRVIEEDSFIKRKLMPMLMRMTYKKADSVVANSVQGARLLEQFLGWSEYSVSAIYNPANSSEILRLASEPLDHAWFDENSPPVIVAVGRLSREKGINLLLRAVATVSKEVPCRLLILGEGPERAALEREIKALSISSIVEMPGATDNPFKYLANAAVLALPSYYEGLPNILIEAQICGTPIIATDCETGPDEILLGGKAGTLVPVGDVDSVSQAIVDVLKNPEAAQSRANIAKQFTNRFKPDIAYGNYRKLF